MNRRIGPAGAGALFSLAFQWAYISFVAEMFQTNGFDADSASAIAVVGVAMLHGAMAAIMPRRVHKPSDAVAWVFYLAVFVPTTTVAVLSESASNDTALLVFTLAHLAIIMPPRLVKLRSTRFKPISGTRVLRWLGVVQIVTLFLVAYVFGLTLDLPSLDEVYNVRLEYKEAVGGSLARLARTMVRYQSSTIAPAALILAVNFKRREHIGLTVVVQILIFGVTGFKSALLRPLVVLAFAALASRKLRSSRLVNYASGSIVGVVALASTFESLRFPLISILVRRGLALPGLLNLRYFEYFSENSPSLLSGTIFNPFIAPIYDRALPRIIGQEYFGSNTWANAGALGHTAGLFGPFGPILAGLVISAIFIFVDRSCRGTASSGQIAFGAALSLSLINGGLTSALIGGGLILGLFFVGFIEWNAPGTPVTRISSGTAITRERSQA